MGVEIVTVNYRSDGHLKEEVKRFLGSAFSKSTEQRLAKPWGEETYGLVCAVDGERIIGTTSYTISRRGQGIVSQVFTAPERRRQGIGTRVLQEVVRSLRDHHARAAYLAVWVDWIERLYMKCGFRRAGCAGPRVAMKLTLDPSGEDENLFRPGQQCTFREMRKDDQCDLSSLFNAPHGATVKNYTLNNFLGAHFEPEFYELLERLEKNRHVRTLVLDGEETVVGFGTLAPLEHYLQQHRAVIDFLIHPNYLAYARQFVSRLESATTCERMSVFSGPHEAARIEVLEGLGYQPVRTWRAFLKDGQASYDLVEYEKAT